MISVYGGPCYPVLKAFTLGIPVRSKAILDELLVDGFSRSRLKMFDAETYARSSMGFYATT